MVAATRLRMSDISRQKRFETGLDGELTPRHSVGQAVEFYLDRMRLPPNELRWSAFSRGVSSTASSFSRSSRRRIRSGR